MAVQQFRVKSTRNLGTPIGLKGKGREKEVTWILMHKDGTRN